MSHYYRKDGTAAHFEAPNGKPTTLRQGRKLDLLPSVTTVMGIVSKPALTKWIAEEAAMTAADELYGTQWDHPSNDFNRQWARKMRSIGREKTMVKASEGTDIHDVLERYFLGEEVEPWDAPMCEAVSKALIEHCGDREWIPEATVVSEEYGFAGKVDLHAESVVDLDDWTIDFKSKDHIDDKVRGFPEQAWQLAAYRQGLGLKGRIANIFISRANNAVCFFEHKNPDYAWQCFLSTLRMWQVHKKFGVYWEEINK